MRQYFKMAKLSEFLYFVKKSVYKQCSKKGKLHELKCLFSNLSALEMAF